MQRVVPNVLILITLSLSETILFVKNIYHANKWIFANIFYVPHSNRYSACTLYSMAPSKSKILAVVKAE